MKIQDTVISFYKFVPVEKPEELRSHLKRLCEKLKTKGTILIATEGINGMVSGPEGSISGLIGEIKRDSRFSDIEFKKSHHNSISFRRMLVKVKKYIITMREKVDPFEKTGAYLDPKEFKKWQDEGRDMLILDTRNDYEVALGTFKKAIDPKIKTFDEFPQWIRKNLQEARDKPIVTFCTGGIRCEKATAYMLQLGFKSVYQLDGGIIRYLEKTIDDQDNNHWIGECVVFDKRKAVTKALEPTEKDICYVCLKELTRGNLHGQAFPAGKACIDCGESMKRHRAERQEKGLNLHRKNLKKRALFLASERKKFSERMASHGQSR